MVCAAFWLSAGSARAEPPGAWAVGVERWFGVSRVNVEDDPGGEVTVTSISLFSAFSGQRGYSSPRLALDYLSESGVSVGGAIAYESIGGDAIDQDIWVFAGRLGYFGEASSDVGIWPRAGLTHISSDAGVEVTATALTLELPLVFLVNSPVSLLLMPHADIGIASSVGDNDEIERTVTELGLQFGATVFF